LGLTSAWAIAQDENETKSKGEVRSITGCLTKSESDNEYLLRGSDGSTWEIHENGSVDLAKHVNQTVDVRGVVSHERAHEMKEDAKEMGHDAGMKNNTGEHGHLNATHLRKVSDSCQ
jgi:hypothetical protein